jgi:magnesium-transporting ATPase (P-type)
MAHTDFRENPMEKLKAPRPGRPGAYNWGLFISIFFAIGLFFLGLYLYSVFFPNNDITTLVAVKIIFLVFLLFFILYSIFALYHAFRFGFQGDLTVLSAAVYIIISAAIIIAAATIIF